MSLAGPNGELCDSLSRGARFEAALRGIQELSRAGGQASVDLMLLPQHVGAVATHLADLRRRMPAGTPLQLGLAYVSGRERGDRVFGSKRLGGGLDQGL